MKEHVRSWVAEFSETGKSDQADELACDVVQPFPSSGSSSEGCTRLGTNSSHVTSLEEYANAGPNPFEISSEQITKPFSASLLKQVYINYIDPNP